MVTANWVFVILAGAAIAGTMARVPREEQMIVDQFREECKVYMKRTGRLIPR